MRAAAGILDLTSNPAASFCADNEQRQSRLSHPARQARAVSRDDSDFKLRTLLSQLQFETPPELTDTQAIFVTGNRRTRVDRADVIVARFDGMAGANQFGV